MKIMFHMKSGRDLIVNAESIKINKRGNELEGWEIKGVKDQGQVFYICIAEVEAITYKE